MVPFPLSSTTLSITTLSLWGTGVCVDPPEVKVLNVVSVVVAVVAVSVEVGTAVGMATTHVGVPGGIAPGQGLS